MSPAVPRHACAMNLSLECWLLAQGCHRLSWHYGCTVADSLDAAQSLHGQHLSGIDEALLPCTGHNSSKQPEVNLHFNLLCPWGKASSLLTLRG